MNFTDQVVLVTGSSRGLGQAFAQCIADAGGTVVINSTGKNDEGAQTAKKINASGGKALYVPGRVEDASALIERVVGQTGRLDAVVHNAGFLQDKTLRKMDSEHWDAVLDAHLKASFLLSKAAWPHFEEQGSGRLVFITSAAGLYGNFGQGNYAAAKMGMYGLCRSIAIEGEQGNIRCNCVAPFGATTMNSGSWPEEQKAVLKTSYVAPLVGYLTHPDCYETGSLFEASAGAFKKVRWERSHGLTLPTDTPMTIDQIADGWQQLTDFSESDHPANMREALFNMRS